MFLDVLARQWLVKALGSGRTQLNELNAAHPLASSLDALFHDEQDRWDARNTALEQAERLLAELDDFAARAEGHD